MRLLVILAFAAIGLGGCTNRVYSEAPLFSGDERLPDPRLKRGVWIAVTEDCKAVDTRAPVSDWPGGCGVVFGRHAFRDAFDGADYTLVAGDPMIVQQREGKAKPRRLYHYYALRLLGRDGQTVTEFAYWEVACTAEGVQALALAPRKDEVPARSETTWVPGPEPQAPPPDTRNLFPGLEPFEEDCLASDAASLRNAAVGSAQPVLFRWVRPVRLDGEGRKAERIG